MKRNKKTQNDKKTVKLTYHMEEFQDLQNVVHSIEMNLKIQQKKF